MSGSISLRALELSVKALEIGLQEQAQYPHLLTVRDGVIQRFEIVIDTARQLLIRILKEDFFIEELPARKDTVREAAKLGFIADAEAWMRHINARNRTSHTYDSVIAEQVFQHIQTFMPDARDLLKRMQNHVA